MPITVTAAGPIPNYFGKPNKGQRASAQEVIKKLDYADIWRNRQQTLYDNGTMRLDIQGTIPGPPERQNLQVQVDGVKGHSTVAHADVSSTIQTTDPANQRGVVRKVQSALMQSLDSGDSYDVRGTSP